MFVSLAYHYFSRGNRKDVWILYKIGKHGKGITERWSIVNLHTSPIYKMDSTTSIIIYNGKGQLKEQIVWIYTQVRFTKWILWLEINHYLPRSRIYNNHNNYDTKGKSSVNLHTSPIYKMDSITWNQSLFTKAKEVVKEQEKVWLVWIEVQFPNLMS